MWIFNPYYFFKRLSFPPMNYFGFCINSLDLFCGSIFGLSILFCLIYVFIANSILVLPQLLQYCRNSWKQTGNGSPSFDIVLPFEFLYKIQCMLVSFYKKNVRILFMMALICLRRNDITSSNSQIWSSSRFVSLEL